MTHDDRHRPAGALHDDDSCRRADGLIDNDAWRALSRRRFVQALGVSGSLAAQGVVLGSALTGFSRAARGDAGAPAAGDDHYFIFVELAGGFYWPMALDARDPAAVAAGDPANYEPIDVRTPWKLDRFGALRAKRPFTTQNGGGCLLPYDSRQAPRWQDSLTVGRTALGLPYFLGFCGAALQPVVDQLAVVRGVKMAGNFHGKGNASDDMWSGTDKGDQPHVASVLAALLEQRSGAKPLDNLVLENAFFPENEAVGAKAAIRTDGRTLGSLLSSFAAANQLSGMPPAMRFANCANVATAVLAEARARLGDAQAGVFQAYIDKFAPALTVQGSLLTLGEKLGQTDISLDLTAQFDLAMTLMEAGLTRVVTLCLGAPNATNLADPNGLFDAHSGLYSGSTPPRNSTENNWQQIAKTMDSIAAFVSRLGRLAATHPLKDRITVCITSEFTRQGGLNGNERSSATPDGLVHFGGGHNFQNNNYVFFGKGVRGGAWLGRAGGGSLVRYDADFAKLATTPLDKLQDEAAQVFTAPSSEDSVVNVTSEPPAARRGLASRDMLRTALAFAGLDNQYDRFYARPECRDAQVVAPVTRR